MYKDVDDDNKLTNNQTHFSEELVNKIHMILNPYVDMCFC